MPATTPEELHRMWGRAFAAGDLDELMALYEPDAVFMAQPGQVVQGHDAIRQSLEGLLAMQPSFEFEFQQALEADGIALLYSRWRMTGTDPGGNPFDFTGQTSDVARRQARGHWLVLIDNPYGSAGIVGR